MRSSPIRVYIREGMRFVDGRPGTLREQLQRGRKSGPSVVGNRLLSLASEKIKKVKISPNRSKLLGNRLSWNAERLLSAERGHSCPQQLNLQSKIGKTG